jgi:hypothetical protein
LQATTLVFEEEPMSMPMSILGKREVISKIGEVEGEWNESGGGRATEKKLVEREEQGGEGSVQEISLSSFQGSGGKKVRWRRRVGKGC